MRVGLYFLEQEIPSGSGSPRSALGQLQQQRGAGPVLKMVLCKAAVGKSIYREEGDVEAITRCPSGCCILPMRSSSHRLIPVPMQV